MARSTLVRTTTLAAVVAFAALGLSACGSDDVSAEGATQVKVTATSENCIPEPATVQAGALTFNATNQDASAVSEVELVDGDKILGEKENLAPGLSGTFTLRVEPGTYAIYCPGANTERTTFTVLPAAATPGATPGATAAAAAANLKAATQGYHDYVVAEVGLLTDATKKFTDAVRAGDVAEAKAAFASARYHYETIEPVAESFGDLDPQIDGRADDGATIDQVTGFHRLEYALWNAKSTKGMDALATKLDADVAKLKVLVADEKYQPAQIANGASALLDEVAASKITGEEDRYSHTDLSDFAANIEGARKAFDLLVPVLTVKDAALVKTINARFDAVTKGLAEYRTADGYKPYTALTEEDRKALAQSVDALAEPLSTVAAQVA